MVGELVADVEEDVAGAVAFWEKSVNLFGPPHISVVEPEHCMLHPALPSGAGPPEPPIVVPQ